MIQQLQEQTYQHKHILAFCSGYDEPLQYDGVDIYMVPDRQDWGHEKRAMGVVCATGDFLGFFNDDDEYNKEYLTTMIYNILDHDLAYCRFTSHLFGGRVVNSVPKMGAITSGNFLIRTELAKRVGYNHRMYEADGKFIEDVMKTNPRHIKVDECLYTHK